MVAINTLPILLMSFIAIAITSTKAGEITFEYNSDNSPPHHPLFACEIKSTKCRRAYHYTHLIYHPLDLKLSVCYNPFMVKAWYHHLNFAHKNWGDFVSTYYVTCPRGDKQCLIESQRKGSDYVQEVVQAEIDEQTYCNASVRCWEAKNLVEHCYKNQHD
ncbi:uncharacterized protein UDID_01211 [Ustilago sp. UG-2017a]|nr:uncharacterized protein UDID_01211 [Ustilago sp. UG-2017a]